MPSLPRGHLSPYFRPGSDFGGLLKPRCNNSYDPVSACLCIRCQWHLLRSSADAVVMAMDSWVRKCEAAQVVTDIYPGLPLPPHWYLSHSPPILSYELVAKCLAFILEFTRTNDEADNWQTWTDAYKEERCRPLQDKLAAL
jgi:hypothetical protein